MGSGGQSDAFRGKKLKDAISEDLISNVKALAFA